MVDTNKLDLILGVPSPATPDLLFGSDTTENGLYAPAIVTSIGVVSAEITTSAFPITGNSTTTNISGFTSVSQTVDLFGVQINTEQNSVTQSSTDNIALSGNATTVTRGNITLAVNVAKALLGNQSSGNVGTVIYTYPITGNFASGQVNAITFEKTVGQIIAIASVGSLSVSQSLDRSLNGNQLTGEVNSPVTSNNIAISGNVSAISINSVAATITNNYISSVLGITSPGNIAVSQSYTKALTGNQTTGFVNQTGAGVSVFPLGVSSTVSLGILTQPNPVDHDYFATANKSTTAIGSVTTSVVSSRALTGNQATGNVAAMVITLPLLGNIIVGQVNNILDAEHSFGTLSSGYVGSLTARQNLDRLLIGNEIAGVADDLFAFKTTALSGNSTAGQTGTIIDVHSFGVFATRGVGSVTTSTSLTRQLIGNEATGIVRDFIQSYPSSVSTVNLTGETGLVTTSRTADYAGSVVSALYVGSILTSNEQVKAIDSQSYRSLSLCSVGSIIARQTKEITGVAITSEINGINTAVTNNHPSQVETEVLLGVLGLTSTGQVPLSGVSALGYTGVSYSAKLIPLVGRTASVLQGQITARASFGVKAILSVGSITSTYQQSVRFLSGNSTTVSEGIVRNFKYSPLTGNSIDVLINNYKDVEHSLGVRALGQINSVGVSISIDTYPIGKQATGFTGNVFATQTVDLTGVTGNLLINNYKDVEHSLGVISYANVGSVKFVRSYELLGKQATGSVGNLGVRTAYFRNLVGNQARGTIYKNLGPDEVYLDVHHEIEIPKTYSLNLEGDFSVIDSFECINCKSPLIELYNRDKRAWIRLNTPGSFEDSRLYYVDTEGNYDSSFSWDTVPEDASVYKIEANKILQLIFVMKGTYDDGGPRIKITRKYYIDIVVDHSFDRDTLGTTEVV
jgi:hypothetical protein